VKPEDVHNYEVGLKTAPFRGVTANIAAYDTEIDNFQAQVVNSGVGVLRGYLANARKVRVNGAEFDGSAKVNNNLSFFAAAAYINGKYVSFPDAPPPLEETGGPQFKDISGSLLPGISKWALSLGSETVHRGTLLGKTGEFFAAADASYRSKFSSSATFSNYLMVSGYPLFNARIGFRATDSWTAFLWSRNLLNKNYYDLLSAVPGNSGLLAGQPGDPRTFGLTLRRSF
jgi:iron complex outermembrane receptor protein